MITTVENTAAEYLARIQAADAKAAALRTEFEQIVADLPVYQGMNAAATEAAKIREEARAFFAQDNSAVVATHNGKIGMQQRRSITYTPASVRALAPEIAHLVIEEAVNGTNLKKFVAPLIKAGKAPADLMEMLESQAEVKTTYAFICQPSA